MLLQCSRLLRCAPSRSSPPGHPPVRTHVRCRADSRGPLDDVEAYAEAQAIYQHATKLASYQTRYDLEATWASEPTTSSTASAPSDPPSESAVTSFFLEQGLSSFESIGLFRQLYGKAGEQQRLYSLDQLAAKIQRWQRVLPDLNVARLAANDADILHADISQGLRSMIVLVEKLPTRDVLSMVAKQPRILWCEDLIGRIDRTTARLMLVHPSRDEDIVKDMIVEHPELLYRMDYYPKATMIDDLPIEIQNMMVVADQSIGATFRYYRNRRTNYEAENTSDELFDQQS